MYKQRIFFAFFFSLTISLGAMQPEQPIDPNQPLTGQKRPAQTLQELQKTKWAHTEAETDEPRLTLIGQWSKAVGTRQSTETEQVTPLPWLPADAWGIIFSKAHEKTDPDVYCNRIKTLCLAMGTRGKQLLANTFFTQEFIDTLLKNGLYYQFRPDESFLNQLTTSQIDYSRELAASILNTPASRALLSQQFKQNPVIANACFAHLMNTLDSVSTRSLIHENRALEARDALLSLTNFRPALSLLLKTGVLNASCINNNKRYTPPVHYLHQALGLRSKNKSYQSSKSSWQEAIRSTIFTPYYGFTKELDLKPFLRLLVTPSEAMPKNGELRAYAHVKLKELEEKRQVDYQKHYRLTAQVNDLSQKAETKPTRQSKLKNIICEINVLNEQREKLQSHINGVTEYGPFYQLLFYFLQFAEQYPALIKIAEATIISRAPVLPPALPLAFELQQEEEQS